MKYLPHCIVTLILLLFILYAVLSPCLPKCLTGRISPLTTPQKESVSPQPAPAPASGRKSTSVPKNNSGKKGSVAGDISDAADYATGATAIRAKGRMLDKLQKAQDKHNKQQLDALGE